MRVFQFSYIVAVLREHTTLKKPTHFDSDTEKVFSLKYLTV